MTSIPVPCIRTFKSWVPSKHAFVNHVGATISDFQITSITNGFSYFGAGKGSEPLPVELLSFSGECSEGVVSLNWQTASEQNSDYFFLATSSSGQLGIHLKVAQYIRHNIR